jgi:hypothetical protein
MTAASWKFEREGMKRTHAAAFQKDALSKLPPECENIVFGFLSILDLCMTVAPASSRLKAVAYDGRNWKKIKMLGVQNQRAQQILRVHGRKIESLMTYGMRISRAVCKLFSRCTMLESLNLTGIWKSSAIDRRFVKAISSLPLKRLLFGQNEVCDEGFDHLCTSLEGLKELDFNSRIVSSRSLYNVCMLSNLERLCIRSCANANEDTVRSISRLQKLKSLQLSFLPMLHCNSLRHLYENESLQERLESLVLNGMHLDARAFQSLSLFRNLEVLSLCHPKINSRDLAKAAFPRLRIATIFCSSELYAFDFLGKMPLLHQLCLYRCACSFRSLMQWVERKKTLHFRLYQPRPIRINGRLQEPEGKIDYDGNANLTQLRLMRKPHPILV